MNYLFDQDFLSKKTVESKAALASNKPDANFVEFASSIIYERLKSDISRYRVYGPYWWALKDVLNRQGHDIGNSTDDRGVETSFYVAEKYKGVDDAETLVAADTFYLDMSSTKPVDNNAWTLDNRKPDYVLYDSDMEERASVADSVLSY